MHFNALFGFPPDAKVAGTHGSNSPETRDFVACSTEHMCIPLSVRFYVYIRVEHPLNFR